MSAVKSLKDYTHPDSNSFGLVRLVAAMAVIVSHAWILTGFGEFEPLIGETGIPLGAHAVNIFMVLSGFMIAASADRSSSILNFLFARFLRIYPAVMVVTVLSVLIGGFVLTILPPHHFWTFENVGMFLMRNVMMNGGGASLEGIFLTNPVADGFNTPLWTIKYELVCYLLIAGLMFVGKISRWRIFQISHALGVSAIILLITGFLVLQAPSYHEMTLLDHFGRFFFTFFLGVLTWQLRSRIPLSCLLLVALFGISSLLTAFDSAGYVMSQYAFTGYLALYLGHFDYGRVTRLIRRQDYSFGLYVTAYPVQQALVYYGITSLPVANALITLPIAFLLAWVLWNYIERPSLSLKSKVDVSEILRRILHFASGRSFDRAKEQPLHPKV